METSRAKIAVVGIGAIGGSISADLADLARHDLHLCLRTPIEALRVSHPGGKSRIREQLHSDPAAVPKVDWVLLATKTYQSEAARPWLRALCRVDSVVAVLQNGVDHVQRITPLVPEAVDVLPVVVLLPAEKIAAGDVTQERDGTLLAPDGAAGRRFAALFDGARTKVLATPDFHTQSWWKLISNAALGGVCALTQRSNAVAKQPELREFVLELMREIAEVGRAEGAELPEDAPEKALGIMLGAAGDHWTSIAVDRREGRPMEWQARNEVVGRLGRVHGIATPMNDAITILLRAADADR